jgi:hypothetical protein
LSALHFFDFFETRLTRRAKQGHDGIVAAHVICRTSPQASSKHLAIRIHRLTDINKRTK